MRVRARLSSLAERSGTRPYQLTDDTTYTFLAAAFTTNPHVVVDEDGAWLSAIEIDAADDAEGANSFDVRDAALGLLARMNGAMELIAGEPHYRACDLASTSVT